MNTQRDPAGQSGINELLGDALRHAADLLQSEVALFRAEVAQNVRRIGFALAMIVLGAVFCVIALSLAVGALTSWLAPILGSEALAEIVCAAGAAVVAIALFAAGLSMFRVKTVYPERTVESIKDDVRMIQGRAA